MKTKSLAHTTHTHTKTQRLADATTVPALLELRETLGTSFPHTVLKQESGSSGLYDIIWEKAGDALAHHLPCMQRTPPAVPREEPVNATASVLGGS